MNQSSLSGNKATFNLTSAQEDQLEAEAKNVTFLYFYVTNNYSGESMTQLESFGAIVLASAFYDFIQAYKSGQFGQVKETLISSLDKNNHGEQMTIDRNPSTGVLSIGAQGSSWYGYTSSGMTLKIYGIK